MAHVGVERFAARYREHHRRENVDAAPAVPHEVADGVLRQERGQNLRIVADVVNAQRGQRAKPNNHHRAK